MSRSCPICDLAPQVLVCGDVVLDRRRAIVTVDGEDVHLKPAWFEVLEILMSDPGRVWSKDQFAALIDPRGFRCFDGRVIDQYICNLRRSLHGAAFIGNRHGFGWWIEPFAGQTHRPANAGSGRPKLLEARA